MWGLDAAWRERLLSYQSLVVGFSGGLDSTVLLHMLAKEPKFLEKLQAVYIHHGLSAHADAWQVHCEAFCSTQNIKYITKLITLKTTSNLEEAARLARHEVFKALMDPSDCLLLAHHKDDQAETLLLNLLRGTGIEGLAAMPALKPFGKGHLARPLLHQTRDALQAYANQHQLTWVEDESNQDTHFTRNYLRHEILPRLKARWPSAIDAIYTCATHAKTATQSLCDLAFLDCPALLLKQDELVLTELYALPRARLIQVIRVWLKQQAVKAFETRVLQVLIDEVIFAKREAMPCLQVGGVMIRRYRDVLYVMHEKAACRVPLVTKEVLSSQGLCVPLGCQVSVCFRCGGEKMLWRGHTRSLKKIFQTLGVPPWLRDTIPLIFIDKTLVSILDFAIADGYHESQIKKDFYDTV